MRGYRLAEHVDRDDGGTGALARYRKKSFARFGEVIRTNGASVGRWDAGPEGTGGTPSARASDSARDRAGCEGSRPPGDPPPSS
jgi:hypothetical protein